MAAHAKGLDVEVLSNEVKSLDLTGDEKKLVLRDREVSCKAVILATGGQKAKLKVTGEEEYLGKGVSYCATCDGPFFKGKAVVVVGEGNMAAEDAIYMSELATKTYLIAKDLKADKVLQDNLKESSVEVIKDTLTEIVGEDFVSGAKLASGKTLEVGGVFICAGSTPSTELAEKAGVKLDEKGFISVDRDMATNLAGVFAAGDVTGGIPQITVAAGEGAVAALRAYSYVKNP